MSFKDKFLDFIGIQRMDEEALGEAEEEQEEIEEPVRRREVKKSSYTRAVEEEPAPAKVNASNMKMIVYHPVSLDDAKNVVDNLLAKRPVIVNMEEIGVMGSKDIQNFLFGAVYALDGSITKISREIFVVAPRTYSVEGSMDEEYIED